MERMVRIWVQHVRGGGRTVVLDVCTWGFRCLRSMGIRGPSGVVEEMVEDRKEFGSVSYMQVGFTYGDSL